MTMAEMKPSAITEFNLRVSDAYAQEYFADAWDLWKGSECLYDTTDAAYKAIIRRYAKPISAEVARVSALLDTGATKRITAVNASISNETGSTGKVSSNTINETTTENDGEFSQTVRTYPDGFINAPDASYIKGQTVDSPYEQITGKETTSAGSEDNTDEKEIASSGNVDTEETDTLARAQLLAGSQFLSDLIERCVFAFLAGTAQGEF